MAYRLEDLADAFRRQAGYCKTLGSPLWAGLMRRAADDIAAGGLVASIVGDWSGDLDLGALALRFFGGLHYLALSGRAPALAAELPSTGGKPGPNIPKTLLATVAEHAGELRQAIARPPQTNEVGRSAVLLGGFLRIAARTGLPLSLYEFGASAGLNLCWDRFSYELGRYRWRGGEPTFVIAADWRGASPDLAASVTVAGRRGCDLRPIDLTNPDARLWLQAYIWPDQRARLAMLREAMAMAMAIGIRVERESAAPWIDRILAERSAGETTVIFHSVVMQYLTAEDRAHVAGALANTGTSATPHSPLAWLRLEHDALMDHFVLRLTLWPAGEEILLAAAHPHGRWVDWRG